MHPAAHQDHRHAARAGDLALRLAAVVKDVELDCGCRARLDAALQRFAAIEEQRAANQHLAEGREQRDRIRAVLSLLADLDDLYATESDHSVYQDLALLFEDIAASAHAGAEAMRQVSAALQS